MCESATAVCILKIHLYNVAKRCKNKVHVFKITGILKSP